MRALLLLFLCLLTPGARAQSVVQNTHARVELAAEGAYPGSGRPVALALRITPQPGWHSYYVNPGEAGAPNRLTWTLPGGATVTPPRYPVPEALLVSGIMNHVYSRAATLLVDFVDPGAQPVPPGSRVALHLDYLVCSADLCVPERADLSLALTTTGGAPDSARAILFAAARAALPKPLLNARFARTGRKLALLAPIGGAVASAHFFSDADGVVIASAAQPFARVDGGLRLETMVPANALASSALVGVLRIERPGGAVEGYSVRAVPGAVPTVTATAIAPVAERAPDDAPGLPLALLLAVAGGLVLNVMPCVFPILSLKALSLARSGADAAAGKREALAYAAGVILVMLALGATLIGLRAAGASAGWAFQLQDPRVVLALMLLMTAIALNLAGLFEVNVGSIGGEALVGRGGTRGAFFTGALAAFVATPCTGPFMGVALGAALVLPPAEGLAIFAGLGAGLALPFVALAYVPALRRALPKPGAWMARLRHILAVPMFATALALAWVLGRQAGVAGMTLGLAGALAVGLALWWFGGRQRGGGGVVLPLGFGLAGALAAVLLVAPTAPAGATAGSLGARPFTEAALADLTAHHRPVFVYLTADWCITCKVNERGAMADASVAEAFAAHGVGVLEGDWTRGDPAITRYLAANHRSGVPLYLFYHADGRVELLPQLLTPARLRALV